MGICLPLKNSYNSYIMDGILFPINGYLNDYITKTGEHLLKRQAFLNVSICLLFMILYVCNTKSKIVHNASLEARRCKLEEIKTEERELFTSLMKAIMQGYVACPHCIGYTR